MIFRFLGLAGAMMLALTLAVACGGDDDDGGGGGNGGNGGETPLGETPLGETPLGATPATPLEEYLQNIDAIFKEADQATEGLRDKLNDALDASETVDDQVAALDTFLSGILDAFEEAAGQMDALEPPADAKGSHTAFLLATNDVVDLTDQFLDKLADIKTVEELDALINDFDSEISKLTDDADSACFELQDLADENSIDVDLNCGD